MRLPDERINHVNDYFLLFSTIKKLIRCWQCRHNYHEIFDCCARRTNIKFVWTAVMFLVSTKRQYVSFAALCSKTVHNYRGCAVFGDEAQYLSECFSKVSSRNVPGITVFVFGITRIKMHIGFWKTFRQLWTVCMECEDLECPGADLCRGNSIICKYTYLEQFLNPVTWYRCIC